MSSSNSQPHPELSKSDFYHSLRQQVRSWLQKDGKKHKWSEYLLLAPDLFHLLCKLTFDKRIPTSEKAKLASAIAYFVSPIDVIPEAIFGVGGYVDDVALAAFVLNSLMNNSDPEIVKEHWAGEGDVLDLIGQIISVADQMVGSGAWKKLKEII
ncbi:MAG: DUF1232 domain-containing protein [Calditrichaeota bacterium]|nr:DUF1232 domain-containing protein [Calditrichota bacterium]